MVNFALVVMISLYAFLFSAYPVCSQVTSAVRDIQRDANETQVLQVSLLQTNMQVHKSTHVALDDAKNNPDEVWPPVEENSKIPIGGVRPRLIDTHCHMLPPVWRQLLVEAGVDLEPLRGTESNVTEIMEKMVYKGVSIAVFSISPELAPQHFLKDSKQIADISSKINSFFASDAVRGLNTPSRFGAFAMLPMPDVTATLAEIKRTLVSPGYYHGHVFGWSWIVHQLQWDALI